MDFNETRASARQLADETDTVGLLWDGERVDDMEPIAGIGRVFEQRLYEAGLTTYESIASTTPEHLAEVIHAPEFNQPDYGAWINDAKLLVEMRQQDARPRKIESSGAARNRRTAQRRTDNPEPYCSMPKKTRTPGFRCAGRFFSSNTMHETSQDL